MSTILKANNLPVLTWNHFKVNNKQIQLSDKPDTANIPIISSINKNIKIEDKSSLVNFPGTDAKTSAYITNHASLTKTITINKNTHVGQPLIFDLALKNADKLTGLLDIIVEQNSTANIIITVSSANEAAGQYADLIRIKAQENSSLNIICLQLLGKNFLSFNNVSACIENNAKVVIRQIPIGAGTVLASAVTELNGYKAASQIYADYIGHGEQDIDLNYISRHYGKKSLSEIKINGLLLDSSKKTARGTIDFHRGCKGAAGNENENVLLLSENVKNKSVPLLLCNEDDVVGNHGAAIGTLDEEHLFYLKSRGIDEKTAQQIFLDSAVSHLKNLLPETLAAKIDDYNKEVLFNESI